MKKTSAGFTLIELMIAMTIMAFISLGVYEVTTGTFDRREKIEQEGDFYTSIRVALDVMGRDLEQIYTPQAAALPGDIAKTMQQATQASQPGQPGQPAQPVPPGQPMGMTDSSGLPLGSPTEFWGEPVNQYGVRPSRFTGEEDKMLFVTSSHMRIYRDAPESEFAKITYKLDVPKNPEPGQKGKLLMKLENTNAFDDEERAGEDQTQKYPLLEGIKTATFEYYDAEKDTWYKRWDTTSVDHKGVFPSMVKVTLEVFYPNTDNTFTVVQQFRPELPL